MRKPSLNPQSMKDGSYYYEDRRGIDVMKWDGLHCSRSRIPWGRLIKSLERCGYKVTKEPK